ncbi:MAG: N-acetylmuramoyl-L-alanine amidase [Victivallales bacterium]|nr:N-acetylmuramoyl-L-alanine amidase [Victivallales bacterium]
MRTPFPFHRLLEMLAVTLAALLLACLSASRVHAAPAPPPGPSGQSRRPVIHYITINKRNYLRISEIASFYQCTATRKITVQQKTITLTNRHGQKLLFTADSISATLDGYQINFCYKVLYQKGEFYLEQTDFKDFLDPILRTQTVPKRAVKTIMLDPGHGGKDHGTEQGGTMEKDLNLLLAKRIRSILQRRGYTVLMTREKDVETTLQKRSELCAAKKPDLFISVHCNAHAGSTDINGIEVWIANPVGVPSYGTTTLGQDLPGTKYHSSNALLAYLTLKELIKTTKANDRGIRRKQFYVISHSPAPSMLVEFGFLSNEAERKNLLDTSYQDKLCAAVCDAIDKFAQIVAPPKPPRPR